MRRRGGAAGGGTDVDGVLAHVRQESVLTRAVDSVFAFVRFAEFEILFVLFFLTAFLVFKDLEILVDATITPADQEVG